MIIIHNSHLSESYCKLLKIHVYQKRTNKKNRSIQIAWKQYDYQLTFKIIVEFEWWHIPVHCHISPWRTQWDSLFATSPGLSILLGPKKTS